MLLHVLVIWFFLLLSINPLYEFTAILYSHIDEHLVIMNKATMNIHVQVFV